VYLRLVNKDEGVAGGFLPTRNKGKEFAMFKKTDCVQYIVFALLLFNIGMSQAGVIQLVSFGGNNTHFDSKWNWFEGTDPDHGPPLPAGWATPPEIGENTFWKVILQGFDGGVPAPGVLGDLRDTSVHKVGPHPPENPNVPSFFDYAGASAGVGPIVTFLPHPPLGHEDVFTLKTTILGQGVVEIIFSGDHLGNISQAEQRSVPEPSALALLAVAGLGLGLGLSPRLRGSRTGLGSINGINGVRLQYCYLKIIQLNS
jgi:hypothetical protein